MAKLIPKNEATLRAIKKLGEACLHDVQAIVGDVAKEAINSLHRCEHIAIVATRSQKTNGNQVRDMHVYAITGKGRMKLQDSDIPPARQMQALKVPAPVPELHKMENFVIPDRKPNVNEMVAEIGGRQVKITYGVHHAYEQYVPAQDDGTRYKPRQIKSIFAMD